MTIIRKRTALAAVVAAMSFAAYIGIATASVAHATTGGASVQSTGYIGDSAKDPWSTAGSDKLNSGSDLKWSVTYGEVGDVREDFYVNQTTASWLGGTPVPSSWVTWTLENTDGTVNSNGSVTLAPGQTMTVQAHIVIPKGTTPGLYTGILYGSDTAVGGQNYGGGAGLREYLNVTSKGGLALQTMLHEAAPAAMNQTSGVGVGGGSHYGFIGDVQNDFGDSYAFTGNNPIQAGTSQTYQINYTNAGDVVETLDFSQQSGVPFGMGNNDVPSSWISFSPAEILNVQPDDTVLETVTVTVPADTQPGLYTGVLMGTGSDPNAQGQIISSAGAGDREYINVQN